MNWDTQNLSRSFFLVDPLLLVALPLLLLSPLTSSLVIVVLVVARNVHMLFSLNHGVSHLNEAHCIDDLRRGSVLGLEILIIN